jgi:hypothetical protein
MLNNQVEKLAEIRARHDDMLVRLGEVLSFARNYKDVNKVRPFQSMKIEGYDYTLLDAVLFAERAIRTFKALKISKNTPVSFASFDQVANHTVTLDGTVNEMVAQMQGIINNTRDVAAISGSRLQVTQDGQILADIADMTARSVSATDQMMVGISAIAGVVGASLAAGNDQSTEIVKDETAEVIAALSQVEGATKETQALLDQSRAAAARAEDLRAELEAKLAEATAHTSAEIEALNTTVAGVGENATKASNDAAVAASKREEMDRLTVQAQEAYKELSGFQATLQATQKSLAKAHERAEVLTTDFETQRNKIEEMIKQAEKMVSGSTVAGLAGTFDKERKALDTAMTNSFVWFVIGIVLLFVTSGALAAYVLNVQVPGLEWLTKRTATDPTLAQVLSRAVIIIAPFWLTLFSARRYRSLFDLRQQYSHKYNMAFAMDGFKTQAPGFAEGIAAWVFTIVAANPVLPKAGTSMDTPPPMTVEGMMKEVREIYGKIMGGKD